MSINLAKGDTINLSKESSGNLKKVTLGLGWVGKGGRNLDLDSFVALRDKNGNNIKFIYFGKLTCAGVKHHGDDLVGGGSARSVNESIDIKVNELKPEVSEITCGLFIYSGASNLSQVDSAFIDISEGRNNLASFDLKESFGKAKSVIVGKLVKQDNNEWEFVTIGQASNKNYDDIKREFTGSSSISSTPSSTSGGGFFRRLFG